MKYGVVEIFDSIQGEGPRMGIPSTFIRLQGCNLSCPWCDTDWSKGIPMNEKEIVEKCTSGRDVVITGGEPTIYNLTSLLLELRTKCPNSSVSIETNGTNSTEKYSGLIDLIICSPKPQTGWSIHPGCRYHVLKYIVDGSFRVEHISKRDLKRMPTSIYLNPEASDIPRFLKEAYDMVMTTPGLRVGIQLHKMVGVK